MERVFHVFGFVLERTMKDKLWVTQLDAFAVLVL
jgi:hypothetical protein